MPDLKRMLLACSLALAASPAIAEAGVTPDSIRIGLFAPMTGKSAIFGQYVPGVVAYYKMINAQGGIFGRKIETFVEDDACDPANAVAATKKLVAQTEVFMMHAGVCTASVLAVRNDLLRQGIPFMDLGAAGAPISEPTTANLFQPIPNTAVVGRTLVRFAMTRPGTTRIAIISHPDEWGRSNHDPAVEVLKQQFKLESVEDVTMERGATDITPQILKLRASKPDVVLSFLYPTETAIFVREAYKYGLRVPLLGCFGASLDDTAHRVDTPDAVKDVYIFNALADSVDSDAMKQWRAMVDQYQPGTHIDDFVLSGIGGAQVIVAALKAAGPNLTRQAFIDALNGIRNFDTGVLAAPIGFTPTDHAGVKSGAMVTFIDGKITSVTSWPKGKK